MSAPQVVLGNYDFTVISISGGKDSQAMLRLLVRKAHEEDVSGRLRAVYADTGAEWSTTEAHVRYLCWRMGVHLEIVCPVTPLPDMIERRGKWPSMSCRYCTSDCKRDPIGKMIRALSPKLGGRAWKILHCTGERREESPKRAKLLEVERDNRLSTGFREVTRWRPVLDWPVDRVWADIRVSGLKPHPAYAAGNERLSCALCVFASDGDLRNGAAAEPALTKRYLEIERTSGHTFRNGRSLAEILRNHPKQGDEDAKVDGQEGTDNTGALCRGHAGGVAVPRD